VAPKLRPTCENISEMSPVRATGALRKRVNTSLLFEALGLVVQHSLYFFVHNTNFGRSFILSYDWKMRKVPLVVFVGFGHFLHYPFIDVVRRFISVYFDRYMCIYLAIDEHVFTSSYELFCVTSINNSISSYLMYERYKKMINN
jgi:hypothetical protein